MFKRDFIKTISIPLLLLVSFGISTQAFGVKPLITYELMAERRMAIENLDCEYFHKPGLFDTEFSSKKNYNECIVERKKLEDLNNRLLNTVFTVNSGQKMNLRELLDLLVTSNTSRKMKLVRKSEYRDETCTYLHPSDTRLGIYNKLSCDLKLSFSESVIRDNIEPRLGRFIDRNFTTTQDSFAILHYVNILISEGLLKFVTEDGWLLESEKNEKDYNLGHSISGNDRTDSYRTDVTVLIMEKLDTTDYGIKLRRYYQSKNN